MKMIFRAVPLRGKQYLAVFLKIAEKAARECFNFDEPVEIVLPSEPEQNGEIIITIENPPAVPLNWHKGNEVNALMHGDYLNAVFAEFIGKLVSAIHNEWFGKARINGVQVQIPNDTGTGKIRLYFGEKKKD